MKKIRNKNIPSKDYTPQNAAQAKKVEERAREREALERRIMNEAQRTYLVKNVIYDLVKTL